jgi:hypothetical protein
LSELKVIRRKSDGHITQEYGYFKFNDFILNNLLQNYTKPVLLDVVLGFKSELAQILYTHLDLIMYRRDYYERRTKELFEDLGLEGESYKHPSKRKQILQKALKELTGVQLTTGIITIATLKRTKDNTDFKLVIRKSAREPLPGTAHHHEVSNAGDESAPEAQPTATANELTNQAKDLVGYFFKRFHNVEKSYPNSKAINQAISLITQYGIDEARHIVDFAHRVAKETGFKIETFGGIMNYPSRALADYEDSKRRTQAAARAREQRRREHEEEQLQRAYEDYRAQEILQFREALEPAELASIEHTVTAKFAQTDKNIWGRDRTLRLAIDDAIATNAGVLSLAQWKELRAHPPGQSQGPEMI